MSFPRYPEYKDSGVEWLGEVPAHWALKRLRFVSHLEAGQSPPASEVNDHSDGLPFLQGNADFGQTSPHPRQSCNSAHKRAEPGDILFSVRAPVGAMNIADRPYGIGRGLCAIRPFQGIKRSYLYYLIWSTRQGLHAVATGSTYEAVSASQVGDQPVLVPSDWEQDQIGKFLDHETARIDALVQEQQRLIELLKEKRQAVISHAVTKGLDPDVPMKDSGVEWLGEVPAHWSILPIKRDLEFLTSGSRGWAAHYSEHGAVFIRIGNLTRDHIRLDLADLQRVNVPEGSEGERTKVQAGDVLFSITAYLGSVAVVPKEFETAYVSQHVALARFLKKKLLPDWVAYVTLSDVGKNYLSAQGYGGTKIQLSLEDVAELLTTVPPLEEQAALTAFLDFETARIDALVEEAEAVIGLLQERRSALISAAVTGKIDVRNWQPPNDMQPPATSTQTATA